jgi:hypothetical protein
MSLFSVTLFNTVAWNRVFREQTEEQAEAKARALWEREGESAFVRVAEEVGDVWTEPYGADSAPGGAS